MHSTLKVRPAIIGSTPGVFQVTTESFCYANSQELVSMVLASLSERQNVDEKSQILPWSPTGMIACAPSVATRLT
jgi:hypothetical protein